jgi:hypothetical protein
MDTQNLTEQSSEIESDTDNSPTLGEIADVIGNWKAQGTTYQSINYIIDRLYGEEIAKDARRESVFRELIKDSVDRRNNRHSDV